MSQQAHADSADAPAGHTWEEAVAWARSTPEMAELVQLCYYDDPIEAAAARFESSEEWSAIVELMAPSAGDKVLEIGAGRGIVSWAFARLGCHTFAVEPDPGQVIGAAAIRQLCATTGVEITVSEEGGEHLPFPAERFDHVVCRGVLHHVRDLDQVCREVMRVLKPGGRFLAIKDHVAETAEELVQFQRQHPLHHLYGGENAYPLGAYQTAIRKAGFRLIHTFGQFDHPVTSAPAITTVQISDQFAQRLSARAGERLGKALARNTVLLNLYRRWLTARTRTPGRLYSFLCEKPV